ncbi:MAG: site-specific DNA-methyltransferase [Gammaproteobacteria bacterium]|nr:site-specific DNA-methyltransferase [Gammaproteobacteria bacterium]
MKLKHAVLQAMSRDELKAAVVALQITDVDRRSADGMRSRLSRARRATPELILTYLAETRVKQVCEVLDVDSKGRKTTLIARLIDREARPKPLSDASSSYEPVASAEHIPDGGGDTPAKLPAFPAGTVQVTRPEFVWPGKYNDDGTRHEFPRVTLPFQVIETVNESRIAQAPAPSDSQLSLFDTYKGSEGSTFEEGWKNKLIWGDNLLVMDSLVAKFAGQVDLIYIDPPFATGADFSFEAEIGDGGKQWKEQSTIEEKAYRDTWGGGTSSYLSMLLPRISVAHELLSPTGTLCVHIDYRLASAVHALLCEVMGTSNFRNNIIWSYGGRGAKAISGQFGRNHDVIIVFTKGDRSIYNKVYRKLKHPIKQLPSHIKIGEDGRPFKTSPRGDYTDESINELAAEGRIFETRTGGVRVKYFLNRKGRNVIEEKLVGDVWDDIPDMMHAPKAERLGYPTQKPERLLHRVLAAYSNPGSLVADFFCGSGTTMSVAERLGRRWIGCDLGRWGVHVTRKRLLDIPECKPFEILNLGQYERQYWQGTTFSGDQDAPLTERALYEYLAFILKLYGAYPVPGMAHIHGRKGKALVHIGAVDAPVTIDDIQRAIDECVRVRANELHVLGWEWEMGLGGSNDLRRGGLMQRVARQQGVKLRLLYIPREVMEQQAVDRGDVRFFELAYMDVRAEKRPKMPMSIRLALHDFVIPSPELIPEDVRAKVKSWSDFIDYWAVDWDFQHDSFMQGWVAYRTREDRSLPLVSADHTYDQSGKYRVLVKVVDVFGNDTSQALDVTVR